MQDNQLTNFVSSVFLYTQHTHTAYRNEEQRIHAFAQTNFRGMVVFYFISFSIASSSVRKKRGTYRMHEDEYMY